MLEVLYKIPSRILAARINKVLPEIIGSHQHGFMTGKSIQDPIIIATSRIQDATKNNKSMQLISFDLEKAFDKTSHKIIEQALKAFVFPEIIIDAIKQGWAIVFLLFALLLFSKRAPRSNLLFRSFQKEQKRAIRSFALS